MLDNPRTGNKHEIREEVLKLSGIKGKSDGQVYIAMPGKIPPNAKLPAVIAVHGSGRGALDYQSTPFYVEQRNIALANGYIFAVISNGADTWGLDEGLYNLIQKHGVEKVMFGSDYPLWNTSHAFEEIENIGLSESEKSLIYAENAKKVFGL